MVQREIVYCEDAAAWEAWLRANHESSPGIRLAIAKKGGIFSGVRYADAVETAIRFGWIDGQKWSLDANHYLQAFAPRGARSIWSMINRNTAIRLIDEGRMCDAGLREVERARADGRWDAAYESARSIEVPADLAEALASNPPAAEFFSSVSKTNRYAILFRVTTPKRPETRARKIAEIVAMLERGETFHPQKPASGRDS